MPSPEHITGAIGDLCDAIADLAELDDAILKLLPMLSTQIEKAAHRITTTVASLQQPGDPH
jgi:hypothetical protein